MLETPIADAHVAALAARMGRRNPLEEDEVHVKTMVFRIPGKASITVSPSKHNLGLRLYMESLAGAHRPKYLKLDAMDNNNAARFWAEKWKDKETIPRPTLLAFANADQVEIEWG